MQKSYEHMAYYRHIYTFTSWNNVRSWKGKDSSGLIIFNGNSKTSQRYTEIGSTKQIESLIPKGQEFTSLKKLLSIHPDYCIHFLKLWEPIFQYLCKLLSYNKLNGTDCSNHQTIDGVEYKGPRRDLTMVLVIKETRQCNWATKLLANITVYLIHHFISTQPIHHSSDYHNIVFLFPKDLIFFFLGK